MPATLHRPPAIAATGNGIWKAKCPAKPYPTPTNVLAPMCVLKPAMPCSPFAMVIGGLYGKWAAIRDLQEESEAASSQAVTVLSTEY